MKSGVLETEIEVPIKVYWTAYSLEHIEIDEVEYEAAVKLEIRNQLDRIISEIRDDLKEMP